MFSVFSKGFNKVFIIVLYHLMLEFRDTSHASKVGIKYKGNTKIELVFYIQLDMLIKKWQCELKYWVSGAPEIEIQKWNQKLFGLGGDQALSSDLGKQCLEKVNDLPEFLEQ